MANSATLDPRTGDALRRAVAAAKAGDLAMARNVGEAALAEGGDVVALNAFLGMLRARGGNIPAAIDHLEKAHAARTGDVTIACNLIAALIDLGNVARAFEVATLPLALTDPSLRIARYRGFLAQSLEKFEDAVEAYEYVISRAPADFESWNNLGNARSAVGNAADAVAALQRAVALDPRAAPTRLNLAAALQAAERPVEAEEVLRQTAGDFPDDARALHELYVQLKQEGRSDEAAAALESAVARTPDNADYHLKLGVEYGLLKRSAEAEAAFRRAITIDPLLVDGYMGLIVQYEHTNREEEFRPLITLAEANGLGDGPLNFMRAMEYRRAQQFDKALQSLAQVPPEIEPLQATHIRATVLDRLGRTDEAFAAFQETNRLHEASPTEPLVRAEELRRQLGVEIEALTPEWAGSWAVENPPADRPDPVFLMGFPRSGTTLLDTIVMGHSRTIVLEEQPPLNIVDKAVGGFAGIAALDLDGIIAARNRYFEEVAKLADVGPADLLIDKSPLFLYKVPLIRRLFPNARFILALRHPCDVLLSCFMSNFRLNAAMSNFLRLEDAASFYDLTFRHWVQARMLFPIDTHVIVYERLVEDVEAEVRPLFDFLGLEWDMRALDHRRTAKERGLITTASYSQVTEPIYKRAAGRWERYRSHLEPILPTLQPWVTEFGYAL